MPAERMLLAAIIAGEARWEFFYGSAESGVIYIGDLRYSTRLRSDGCPVITTEIRLALESNLARKKELSAK